MTVPWAAVLQRVPGILVLCVIPWSFLGPLLTPVSFGIYFMMLHLMLISSNIRSAYGIYSGYYSCLKASTTDYLQKYLLKTGTRHGSDESHDLPIDTISHIIILPNYKETLDTLCESLDVLASHTKALTQYRICLAMEESEEKSIIKAQNLVKMYADFFFEISYTIHPAGRKGEIRGKSSNVAWAASQMALRNMNGPLGGHSHEIITVQDADTCFAEDYFSCISYYYATASPEQRRIMMFTPCTVFDRYFIKLKIRNAGQVPVFVRATDIMWSIGVMSNLYESSNVRIPCSAYSVSMDLALSVNFWDIGPEAIGEDLHMYLKCLFATAGKLIVKPVFSPASQCNVEGSGYGVSGWFSGIQARYTQSYRHLWGSLDTSYAASECIKSWISPESISVVKLKNYEVDKIGKQEANSSLTWSLIFSLFYRLLEAHIVMGHLFFMLFAVGTILPLRSYSPISFLYGSWATAELNWFMNFALTASTFIRIAAIIPNGIIIFYYEKYHQWVAVDRWKLQRSKSMMGRRVDSAVEIHCEENNDLLPTTVQHMGKRPQLVYKRSKYDVFDFAALLLSGIYFFVIPQFHAQICHLWTNSLEYTVASKPSLLKKKLLANPEPIYDTQTLEFSIKVDSFETHSFASNRSSRGDEGFFEDVESSSDL
jgi:hypothetical protein